MKAHTKFTNSVPQIPDWFVSWGISAPIKAIRALRFNFAHDQQGYDVRVVNMSWAYPAKLRTLPWVLQWSTQDIDDVKKTLSLDLAKNDRLYVCAAGNDGTNKRMYPASHDNVLGVSALDFHPGQSPSIWYNLIQDRSSNYYLGQNYYPVSGFFVCGARSNAWRYFHDYSCLNNFGWGASTAPLPGFGGFFPPGGWNDTYEVLGGTSAAVPQVSALAYHLYSRKPGSSWVDVKSRIVNTRGRTIGGVRLTLDNTTYNVKGPADFVEAINGW
jgi:subtilisin family serine protease